MPKNQNKLEKTLCKKCTQNILHCFFCTESPAYFTCNFKDCTSRREGRRVICVAWVRCRAAGQHSTFLKWGTCHRGGCSARWPCCCETIDTECCVKQRLCTYCWCIESQCPFALLHPVVNPGNILQHERASPISNLSLAEYQLLEAEKGCVPIQAVWLGCVSCSVHLRAEREWSEVEVAEVLTLSSLVLF